MKEIRWDSEIKTHISEIDFKRQQLIDDFNLLINAHKKKASFNSVWTQLNNTMKSALLSFTMEENFMRKYNHPDLMYHYSQHKEFLQNLMAFLNRYKTDQQIDLDPPLKAIRVWMIHHIRSYDKHL